MPTPEFQPTQPGAEPSELVDLNVEYVTWVIREAAVFFGVPEDEVVGASPDVYAREVIPHVAGEVPPVGVFYLIRLENEVAGMCGLRRLTTTDVEIKRLYVRPAFRGLGIGQRAVRRLVEDARRFGYERICLDSAPFMRPAHRVYGALGFRDCPAYDGVEVPARFRGQWRFMRRPLAGG